MVYSGELIRWNTPIRLPIVMYHSISAEPARYVLSAGVFRRQLAVLRERHRIIRLSDLPRLLSEGACLDGCAVLTFDDAFADFATNAHPALEAHGMPTTVFVPTGLVGQMNTWDAGIRATLRPIMDRAAIVEVYRSGLVDFGSHTVDHVRMTAVTEREMRMQAAASKEYLEDLLSAAVTSFAYPYGQLDDFSSSTTETIRRLGYEVGVTTHWGTRQKPGTILSLRRIHFRETDSDDIVRAKLAGRYDWIAAKEKTAYYLRRARRLLHRTPGVSGRDGTA